MADAHHQRQVAAHATNVITYGHLGTPTYSETSNSWQFLRQNAVGGDDEEEKDSTAFPFTLLEDSIRPVNDTGRMEEQGVDDAPSTRTGRPRLLRALPEVAPGLAVIDSELKRDVHQRHVPSSHQVNLSDSLGFGGAVLLDDSDKRTTVIPIAAYVAGKGGECVKFVRMERETMWLRDLKSVERIYVIPRIGHLDETWWSSTGEQVQQICFAAAQSDRNIHSTWMAVCQPSSTTIFHPLHRRSPVVPRHTKSGSFNMRQASALDPNLILSIPKPRTGDCAHAHVAFHPQDHETLAIIDVQGNWSIWKIQGKSAIVSRVLYQAHLQISRKTYSWTDVVRPVDVAPYHDGWHRIMWLETSGAAKNVLVCNRMTALVYDMARDEVDRLDMRLDVEKQGYEIMDVKKSSSFAGHFFALTSTHILLFSSKTSAEEGITQDVPVLLFAWQHFRGRPDLSLRMLLVETGRGTIAILTSTMNSVVTAIRFGYTHTSSIVTLTDPEKITLPFEAIVHQNIRHLAFYPVQVRRRPELATDDPDDPIFMKLFMQTSSLGIMEALYLSFDVKRSQQDGQSTVACMALPFKRSLRVKGSKYAERDLHDFVVEDDPEQDTLSDSPAPPESPVHPSLVASSMTLDWRDIYQMCTVDTVAKFATEVGAIEGRLKEGQDERPLQLLSDRIDFDIRLGDIEADSRIFEEMIDRITASPHLGISTTGPLKSSGLAITSTTIFELYSRLVDSWLTSLPPTVSDRARVSKERLIRSVVADLTLASTAVRIKAQSTQAEPTHPPFSQPTQELLSSSFLSPATISSQPFSQTPAAESVEDAARRRLNIYTRLTHPVPPFSTPTSPVLADMLSHLPTSPQTNPYSYDWRATELTLALSHEQDTAQASDPKIRRRMERLAKAKRRQQEAKQRSSPSQAAMGGSNQVRVSGGGGGRSQGVHTSQSTLVIRSSGLQKEKGKKKRTQGF